MSKAGASSLSLLGLILGVVDGVGRVLFKLDCFVFLRSSAALRMSSGGIRKSLSAPKGPYTYEVHSKSRCKRGTCMSSTLKICTPNADMGNGGGAKSLETCVWSLISIVRMDYFCLLHPWLTDILLLLYLDPHVVVLKICLHR